LLFPYTSNPQALRCQAVSSGVMRPLDTGLKRCQGVPWHSPWH